MDCKDMVQEKLDRAMPWVGWYIAAASAVCTLAMAADAFNGFRRKKLWFPCRYFSLNSISLTLLAVAMKLPTDLNTNMVHSETDWIAKHVSIIFMLTALANFMPSLGSMSDKEILANVIALGILAITIAVNVFIQLILLWDFYFLSIVFMIPTILMLHLLAALVSMAIMVPTIKKRLEAKFQEKHKVALREEEEVKGEAFIIDNLREGMMKYWVMTETSSPQFVMARSVVSNTVICFLLAMTLVASYIIIFIAWRSIPKPFSNYKNSTILIQVIQFIGVIVGSIAPTLRWFAVVNFKWSTTSWNGFRKAFKIEDHWIQTLVDWRNSSSGLQIKQGKYRKCLYDAKWFFVTFCIGLQIFTVQLSKILIFPSVLLTSPFFCCFIPIKTLVKHSSKVEDPGDDKDMNLSSYVLLLEGEAELPRRVLKYIRCEADNMIQTGRKKQPQDLVDLLHKFVNFSGVGKFDGSHIPSLHSQEPPNNWTLPMVSLTSIAIALPNISKHERKRLLSSVSKGLSLTKLIEKTLNKNAQLVNIRKASDICWVGVLFYMKWLDIDLRKTLLKTKSSMEVLQELSNHAEEIIMKFKKEERDPIMENPINWPAKVVAANSMYRISRTIFLSSEEENEQTDEGLFERLSVMIADILAACLTNLPHVITTMCHHNAIEKREKSVQKAFLLLGKTEDILQLLQKQEWPSLDHDKAAHIEEWRALFQQDQGDSAASFSPSTSSDEKAIAPGSTEEHLTIKVDC